MHAIKPVIAATALMLTLLITPDRSPALSPATGSAPWGEFGFDGAGTPAVACLTCDPSSGGNSFFLLDPPWTFSGFGFLIVQDAFAIGDQFKVFDNGIEIGDTSLPIGTGNCGSDPDLCFADANVSKGIFPLALGQHSFEILQIAGTPGAGFLCISTTNEGCSPVPPTVPAPEPSSMLLLAIALASAFGWSRREQFARCYIAWKRRRPRR